jgi:hypothetical protein
VDLGPGHAHVSTKNIRSDLDACRQVVQKLKKGEYDRQKRECFWSYSKGVKPLVTYNLR